MSSTARSGPYAEERRPPSSAARILPRLHQEVCLSRSGRGRTGPQPPRRLSPRRSSTPVHTDRLRMPLPPPRAVRPRIQHRVLTHRPPDERRHETTCSSTDHVESVKRIIPTLGKRFLKTGIRVCTGWLEGLETGTGFSSSQQGQPCKEPDRLGAFGLTTNDPQTKDPRRFRPDWRGFFLTGPQPVEILGSRLRLQAVCSHLAFAAAIQPDSADGGTQSQLVPDRCRAGIVNRML